MAYVQPAAEEAWQDPHANGTEYTAAMMQQDGGQQVEQYDGAATAAAAAAAAEPANLQPVAPSKQDAAAISYAAMREALAVNQAADIAAEDATRAVAATQQVIHAVINQDAASFGFEAHYGGGDASGMRRRSNRDMGYGAGSSAAAGQRPNKGLRHFSMKVCEKVESKGTTSYNEVADELVAELKDGTLDDGICYDEKNIRRRVYDAINVLMALDIIAKEKKAIIWKGFPTNRTAAQQAQQLQTAQLAAVDEVSRKAQYLTDLIEQQKALKHLLQRNGGNPEGSMNGTALHLPFILVQSKPDATVEVQISKDMRDVQFNFFNYSFEIHDDALVLKKMLEHENMQQLAAQAAAAPADPMAAAAALLEAAAAVHNMQQPHHFQQQQQQVEEEQQQQEQAGDQHMEPEPETQQDLTAAAGRTVAAAAGGTSSTRSCPDCGCHTGCRRSSC
eukprot:GHUV01003719.1.p1 GENE.GHUV01003719.1~~GHUV01003719.1.p1  ORF type:complete len:447 (+),score=223.46 GHUV01003719.1:1880-3220(+)